MLVSSAPALAEDRWDQLDALIRRDPARRGLIESESGQLPLCLNHLRAAIDHLARFGKTVWLITGFYIPGAVPPAAETDGPPGTSLLAAALSALGMNVRILTDGGCAECVSFVAGQYELPCGTVIALPNDVEQVDQWVRDALRSEPSLSHVIAVERVGPARTVADFGRSAGGYRTEFVAQVPADHHGRCHNMRGVIIDEYTAPLHRVLELSAAARPGLRTIGVGDGGNELGMGAIPWHEVRSRLAGPAAPLIPCRIATDWTILAGVSNWGAQAIAAGCLARRGRHDLLEAWTADREEQRLKDLVQSGLAVDGVTRLYEPTVDGLPFLTYIQPWEGMRRLFLPK
ncbi:MAG TPA: glutamate cyclase domain-containing protein [Planctomycetaceae bacterium]|nr:glutamate cyclase domain-containing protein [Planctomycetaceae bacterium]